MRQVLARGARNFSFFAMPASFNLRAATMPTSPSSFRLGGAHAAHIWHGHAKYGGPASATLREDAAAFEQQTRVRNEAQLATLDEVGSWRSVHRRIVADAQPSEQQRSQHQRQPGRRRAASLAAARSRPPSGAPARP